MNSPHIEINARSMVAVITVCSALVASTQGISAGLTFFVVGFVGASIWACGSYFANYNDSHY